MRIPIRRAIISVFDKAGVEELAAALHGAGCEIVSTGSTAEAVRSAGVPVTEVSEITSFPECLDGRVKTLHPAVHAGILADRRREEHMRQLAELGVEGFDLVVVNLYPFSGTVASGAGYEECIEKIDVGGPSMIRGAAKNHASVAVVTDPSDYARAAEAARRGGFDAGERAALAAKAFARTAAYDAAIARWTAQIYGDAAVDADAAAGGGEAGLSGAAAGEENELFGCAKVADLRYGENPHQAAAL